MCYKPLICEPSGNNIILFPDNENFQNKDIHFLFVRYFSLSLQRRNNLQKIYPFNQYTLYINSSVTYNE